MSSLLVLAVTAGALWIARDRTSMSTRPLARRWGPVGGLLLLALAVAVVAEGVVVGLSVWLCSVMLAGWAVGHVPCEG